MKFRKANGLLLALMMILNPLLSFSLPAATAAESDSHEGYTITGLDMKGESNANAFVFSPNATKPSLGKQAFSAPIIKAAGAYTITYSSTPYADLVTGPTSASEGDTVTFDAATIAGVTFDSWSVTGYTLQAGDANGQTLSFTMPANDVTIVGVYKIDKKYALTGNPVPATGGQIINLPWDGMAEGGSVELRIQPNNGYTFLRWEVTGITLNSSQLTNEILIFKMPANDVNVLAIFGSTVTAHTITQNISPVAAAGSINGLPPDANQGEEFIAIATANPGYQFSSWTYSGFALTTESGNSLFFTMPNNDVTITANFVAVQVDHTISKLVSPAGSGSITGLPLKAKSGTGLTATVTPGAGYVFDHWVTSDFTIAPADLNNPVLNFTMPDQDISLEAVFVKAPVRSIVVGIASPLSGGSIAGLPVTETEGTLVTGTAEANPGYVFDHWETVGYTLQAGDTNANQISFTMPGNIVMITAVFIPDPTQNNFVTQQVFPAGAGIITGLNNPIEITNTGLTVTANPSAGYIFDHWVIDGVTIASGDEIKSPYSFSMPNNNIFVKAYFILDTTITYTLNGIVTPANAGKINTLPTAPHAGDSITAAATKNPGYIFDHWVATGLILLPSQATQASITFNMPPNDVTLEAVFIVDPNYQYPLIDFVNPAGSGIITGVPARASAGTTINATATPLQGYIFSEWKVAGYTVTANDISGNFLSFEMPSKVVIIQAVFVPDPTYSFAILRTVSPANAGAVNGLPILSKPDVGRSAQAVAATGYIFDHWEAVGVDIPIASKTNSTFGFNMPSNPVSVQAVFIPDLNIQYNITQTVTPTDAGTITGPTTASFGTALNFTAQANTGYTFDHWETSGIITPFAAPSSILSFNMPMNDVMINAVFTSNSTVTPPGGGVVNPPDESETNPPGEGTINRPGGMIGGDTGAIPMSIVSGDILNPNTAVPTPNPTTKPWFITYVDGKKVNHTANTLSTYIAVKPKKESNKLRNSLYIPEKITSLPVRYLLNKIEVQQAAKTFASSELRIQVTQISSGTVYNKYKKLTKHQELWLINTIPTKTSTIRIKVSNVKSAKEITVVRYKTDSKKFVKLTAQKWSLQTEDGIQYVHIPNVNGGYYGILK